MIKILYVEDNDDNLYMLKMRLELLGDFEFWRPKTARKGCNTAASEQSDIILMDLEMPVVGGWEATRQLKSNPQTSDIPIIGLSAHAMAGEREKAVAAGCNEFDHTGRIRSSGRNNSAHACRQQSSTFSSTDSVSVKRSQLTSRSLMISPTTTHASTIPVKVD